MRRSTICIALLRKVVAFEYGTGAASSKAVETGRGKGKEKEVEGNTARNGGFAIRQVGEWQTAENEQGAPPFDDAR